MNFFYIQICSLSVPPLRVKKNATKSRSFFFPHDKSSLKKFPSTPSSFWAEDSRASNLTLEITFPCTIKCSLLFDQAPIFILKICRIELLTTSSLFFKNEHKKILKLFHPDEIELSIFLLQQKLIYNN